MSEPDNSPPGTPPAPFAVFCGLDVGKSEHHACALDLVGGRLHDKALPNDETALRTVFTALAEHGRVLVVVDQPASIGALAVAVARSMGIEVAYLPGLAMRRIADLHPGQDRRPRRARDRRRRPHHAPHPAPGRHRRRNPRRAEVAETMPARSPRLAHTLPAQILTALDAQRVVIPGTAAFARVIAGVAAQLRDVGLERADLAKNLEKRLEAHPLGQVLTSMPGLGVRTAIKILTIVGDGSAFPTAGHLAAYAGLAPVTRRSGTSIKGETRSQRGNHALNPRCSCRLSPVSPTPSAAPTTTANAPPASATTPP